MHAQITHDLFDAEFRQVAVAAVQLQRLIGNLEAGIGDKAFGHGAELCRVRILAVERGGRPPQQRARRLQPGRHIGEAELQGLELFQAFAKGAALFHVGQRLFQGDLGAAERAGRNVEPAAVKAGHGDLKTDSFLAQPVAGRYARVLEDDGARRLCVPAHLALVDAERNAWGVARNDQRRDSGRTGTAGSRHHHIEVAGAGSGDELLLAVEDVGVAVAHGARRQRRRVGARTRLGQAIARQKLHRAQLGQPCLALLIGTIGVDHPSGHVVDRHIGRHRRTAGGQCLENQGRVEPGQGRAPDIRGNIDTAHAERGRLAHFGNGEVLGLVPGQRLRGEDFRGKGAGHVADGDLVFSERKLRRTG